MEVHPIFNRLDVRPIPQTELHVPSLGLVLDFTAPELRIDGMVVECPPRALRLLQHLLEHPDRVVSKEELLEQAWAGVHVCESSLHEAISLLRRSLETVDPSRRVLSTIRGRGYRWRAPVVGSLMTRSGLDSLVEQRSASFA